MDRYISLKSLLPTIHEEDEVKKQMNLFLIPMLCYFSVPYIDIMWKHKVSE